jgi:protein disulfide-isomerase A1
MVKQSLPAVSILSKETIEEFKTADKVVLIAYFEADDKASNETFSAVAETLRDSYLFGAVSDAAVAKAEGALIPSVVLYKSFDEGKSTYADKFEVAAIESFVKTASTPLIGEVGPETYSDYMAAGIPLAYIFAETEEERAELAQALKPIAEKHRGAVNFATIDAKAFGAHAGNLNLKTDAFPAFAIQETVKNQKFPYSQDLKISHESIDKFVQDFVDGKIEPSIKSEPVPETQEGPVYTIVAKNYEAIVMDDTKDVLVEFYAPWCGHCKALAPKYEDLAGLYFRDADKSSKVIIAKVDATANDVPDEIQGFPTIKLFPAGGKSAPITYSGDRSIEDLAKFVAENGKYKVEVVIPSEDAEAVADDLPEQADAATKVAEKVAEATEAVKSAASDDAAADHDEL